MILRPTDALLCDNRRIKQGDQKLERLLTLLQVMMMSDEEPS